jgi:hypothetical protein
MLGMAFFKSLVKQHGKQFFEPIGKALAAAGIKKPNPLNPAHAWATSLYGARQVAGHVENASRENQKISPATVTALHRHTLPSR